MFLNAVLNFDLPALTPSAAFGRCLISWNKHLRHELLKGCGRRIARRARLQGADMAGVLSVYHFSH